MYYVYILYSKKLDKKYIGFTNDIKKRLTEHNSGNSEYTSKGVPWKLIYLETFISKEDAQEEERFLKTGRGRDRFKFLLEHTMRQINGEFA